MNDNITIPRWLFDELCERARTSPVIFRCQECGVAEGELHKPSCSKRVKPMPSFEDVAKRALERSA